MAQNEIDNKGIVGFENEAEKIIQYLISGTNELDVIPIVGMGGQGKTTLARMVYDNKSIVARFDVRAWCVISQTYNRRDLLQEILSQVTGSKDVGDTDDILADELKKRLWRRRYLIVLDDMWDINAWEELMLSFPDDENRSRIIVTTRLEEVAKQVKHHTDPYSLPILPLDDSNTLLQKKVFLDEDFPPELQSVCREIADKCNGLPLVIILVAGIIKRNKMEASWWHEVKTSLLSYLGESEEYSLSSMQLSYDNLTDCLKPCLLYMGMFPEDARIPVPKLLSLWIAECFVRDIETAEDYLMALISSNVVIAAKRGYNGKVKYCQVHDVVLHFCFERSRDEKFMHVVKGDFQPSNWKDNRVNFTFSNEFASSGSKTQKSFHQNLKTLITTNKIGVSDGDFFHKVSEMTLLKVLDVSSYRMDYLSSATFRPLVHLKYLSAYTEKFHFHPQSHLPHLETLIVSLSKDLRYSKVLPEGFSLEDYPPEYRKEIKLKPTLIGIENTSRSTTVLPAIFWKMKELRHVRFSGARYFLENDEQGSSEESYKLENLRILKGVIFEFDVQDDVSFIEDVLPRRCPNLQQLDFSFTSKYCILSVGRCLKFDGLTQLQSLRLTDYHFENALHLPSNLKKLVLFKPRMGSKLSLIGGLPSLEYLKLDYPYDEPRVWDLGDITFDNLKVLKLMRFISIEKLDVSEESFPQLETLVIIGCSKLKEIPSSFADIPTLKQIKLMNWTMESLKASAVNIKKEVEDIEGCDRIEIIIDRFVSYKHDYLPPRQRRQYCGIVMNSIIWERESGSNDGWCTEKESPLGSVFSKRSKFPLRTSKHLERRLTRM